MYFLSYAGDRVDFSAIASIVSVWSFCGRSNLNSVALSRPPNTLLTLCVFAHSLRPYE